MPPEHPDFNWEINTILQGETGQPFVGLSIWYRIKDTDPWKLVATWQWSIEEARHKGWEIMAAAEASESDAHMILALRERKMPEEEIQEILQAVRVNRGRA